MSKLFVTLKLHLFSLFFTYWLFRPQKHKVNQRFHVRDMFLGLSQQSLPLSVYVTDCEKKYEIQTALFSKQSGLPSWKHASRHILKCFFTQ